MKTEFEIIYIKKGRKSLMNTKYNSIKSIQKTLKPGEIVTAAQFDINPKATSDSFKRYNLGYRVFEMHNDRSMSYSRFPMYEY